MEWTITIPESGCGAPVVDCCCCCFLDLSLVGEDGDEADDWVAGTNVGGVDGVGWKVGGGGGG